MNAGLEDKEMNLIKTVFEKHEQIEKVYIFGSRAKGNFKPNSDIDLGLVGQCDSLLGEEVAMQLNELPLPYKFDVQIYNKIKNSELKSHIDRVGILIYSKQ